MIRIETIPDAKRSRQAEKPKPEPEPIPDPVPLGAKEADQDVLSVKQIKAARALLDWKQADLAAASGVSLAGLTNIERGSADPRRATMVKIQEALEKAGIEIIHPADGKGEGARMAKPDAHE